MERGIKKGFDGASATRYLESMVSLMQMFGAGYGARGGARGEEVLGMAKDVFGNTETAARGAVTYEQRLSGILGGGANETQKAIANIASARMIMRNPKLRALATDPRNMAQMLKMGEEMRLGDINQWSDVMAQDSGISKTEATKILRDLERDKATLGLTWGGIGGSKQLAETWSKGKGFKSFAEYLQVGGALGLSTAETPGFVGMLGRERMEAGEERGGTLAPGAEAFAKTTAGAAAALAAKNLQLTIDPTLGIIKSVGIALEVSLKTPLNDLVDILVKGENPLKAWSETFQRMNDMVQGGHRIVSGGVGGDDLLKKGGKPLKSKPKNEDPFGKRMGSNM
jgi:hypothetical protein